MMVSGLGALLATPAAAVLRPVRGVPSRLTF